MSQSRIQLVGQPENVEKAFNAFKFKRLTCPNCSHSVTIIKAYTGKKEDFDALKFDDTDFTCPDCKKDLILCKAAFGSVYFSMRTEKPDFSH